MTREELFNHVRGLVEQSIRDGGNEPPEITEATVLLGSGIGLDSLGLATIVVELEEKTGVSPFSGGFVNFTTVGELVTLFHKED
jgi:acyl carrier protein